MCLREATMFKRGDILEAARRDNKALVTGGVFLVAICLGVFALNLTYMRNWIGGPYTFTDELATNPGARRWVRAEGPTLATGVDQRMTVKILKGLLSSTQTTATYKALLCGKKFLV